MSEISSSFYLKNNHIYSRNIEEKTQDEHLRAYDLGISLLKEKEEFCSLQRTDFPMPSNEMWFWLYMSQASRPYGYEPCFCNCGGGDAKGKGILAFLALFVAAVVGAVITGYQALNADEIRQEKEKLKGELQKTTDTNVQAVFQSMISIRHDEWMQASSKAACTAILTAGLVVLTVAAGAALKAHYAYQGSFNLAKNLGLAGSGIVGLGILAHTARMLTHSCQNRKRLYKYHALKEKINDLSVYNPYKILENEQEKVYLTYKNKIFYKQDNNFLSADLSSEKVLLNQGYKKVVLDTIK